MITFCLMTCGEMTEEECLNAIAAYKDQFVFQEVRDVFPQIKALNQMIEQCTTEYLIPLDSDIILNSDAFERINAAISLHEEDRYWHSILFSLYDTLTQKKILALKVLRANIMKNFPFKEGATPDVEHFHRLRDAGYTSILETDVPIGKHVVRGPKFCYHKYLDVYQTLRVYGFEWDNGVFMGGETIIEKSKKHYDYFLKEWILTQNEDYLWCIAGMLDGLTSEVKNESKSLENMPELDVRLVIDRYITWYQSGQSMAIF